MINKVKRNYVNIIKVWEGWCLVIIWKTHSFKQTLIQVKIKTKNLKDKDAYALWKGEWVSKYQKIKKVGYKKLHSVINATNLNDLYSIPGNHTEELKRKFV